MIAIVDYGLGNVQAFANIYRRLGIPALSVSEPAGLADAQQIILPGVGAFDWAMQRLNASGMRDMLERRVLEDRVPVLGVCVGMQMMARSSDEGTEPGLGWIAANVERFNTSRFTQKTHLPHMGWNDISPCDGAALFKGIDAPRYYFLHSYHFVPDHAECTAAYAVYGDRFSASVAQDNIFGAQFHPEKSHDWGVRLLSNFAGF